MGGRITSPIQHYPLSFEREEDFTVTGGPRHKDDSGQRSENTFEQVTECFFEDLLEKRKETIDARKKYHDIDINFMKKKFPHWDYDDIEDLRGQFQTFDINQDGLIDFDELCSVLDELGDVSDTEARKHYFEELDVDGSGAVDFEEYLELVYQMYQKQDPTDNIRQICKRGSEDVKRFRQLSVVQQITGGLF